MHSAPFRTRCLVGKFTSGQSGPGLLYRLEDMPGGRGNQFKFDRVHLLVRGSPFKFDRVHFFRTEMFLRVSAFDFLVHV